MSSAKPLWMSVAAAACVLLASEAAQADPTPAPAERDETMITAGWIVLGAGIAGGATLTTYGLSFDCAYDAYSTCSKRASIAIWGGIGIAAAASTIGLVLVETGSTRLRATADGLEVTGRF